MAKRRAMGHQRGWTALDAKGCRWVLAWGPGNFGVSTALGPSGVEGRPGRRKLGPIGLAFVLTAAVALCALGCPAPAPCVDGTEASCPDAGGPPPDMCNSREEALSDPQCALVAGEERQAFVGFAGDQDWYLLPMPATLSARSLLHVTGGYAAPSTAVNLALNLLREDGQQSLARKVDRHGQGAPKPVDLVLPFSESGAKLLLLVGDEGISAKPNFDVRNPYRLRFEVVENPDVNEPNDTRPTEVTLADQGGLLSGESSGYLATDDDVDRFSFAAPGGRKVVYLHLTAPKQTPPPPFRLSYVLLDPAGVRISEGSVANEFLPVDLATARLGTAGTYTVVVQGYKSANTSASVPGDLRLQYRLEVKIFDEVDPTEPNDSAAAPKVVAFGSPGGPAQEVTGRLGYVPDPDWFAIDLPPLGRPTVLSIAVRPAGGGGRFPPLSPLADRQLRVMTQVTQGATASDRQTACKTDPVVCPKGYDGNPGAQGLVEALCAASDPPHCLWAERNEHVELANLRNLEGTIPVPAHGSTLRYLVLVQDQGNDYADDRDYRLAVRWLDDPDEELRAGLPGQTESRTLQESTSFPSPPSSSEVSGTLSHGHGRVIDHDVNRGEGVRGPEDYDAIPTDFDRFQLDFPALAEPLDRTWTLEWEIAQLPDGGIPSDLALELEFCDGSADAGGCASVGDGLTLAYSGAALAPWYSASLSDRQVLWSRSTAGGATTVTAQPPGCFCIEPRFVRGGRFYVKVGAVDRNSYEPTAYKLRMGLAPYPQSFSGDGGTRACPAPVAAADGGWLPGCRFTE